MIRPRRLQAFLIGAMMLTVPLMPAAADDYDDANRLWWAGRADEAQDKMLPLAEAGDARAQFWVGCRYLDGWGGSRDDAKAIEWITKAANGGNAQAQFNLGVFYRDGRRGVAKDPVEARKWLELSAAHGYAPAKSELSSLTASP